MAKKFWVSARKNYDKKIITTALESGADAVLIPEGKNEDVKKLGIITTISEDGDLKLGSDVAEVLIDNKEKEKEVEKLGGKIPTIIRNDDWTIIPLENLISKTSNLIQTVKNAQEAELALQTMERGADGILLEADDLSEIKATAEVVHSINNEHLNLVMATIVSTKAVGMADRCCIDTASILPPGHGLLCGDASSAYLLVHNENVPSPYCDARPFRVNASSVHAYIKLPNDKTEYLGQIKSGDQVLVVDKDGNTQIVVVGRNKIERRPMMLVTAEHEGKKFSLVMQNAETIRLTSPEGKPLSITSLKKGDEVLAYLEEGGRHFGVQIKETINEK
jgi:3-dehydroquinate synthase II